MGGVRRWWGTIGVTLVAALSIAVAPAAARTQTQQTVALTGSLTLTWQGDGALGCGAQGLCGVSGSLEMVANAGTTSGSAPVPIELQDQAAVARVTDTSPRGEQTTCADLVGVDFVFALTGSTAKVDATRSNQLPSSGRCAGPTASELSGLTLPEHSPAAGVDDLSGQTTFAAGPFLVTAISTLRALTGRAAAQSLGGGFFGGSSASSISGSLTPIPSGRVPTKLQESAQVTYRIVSFTGSLTAAFAGLPSPLCDPLGACAASGSLSASFSGGGPLQVIAFRPVTRRVGRRAALADLRAGRLRIEEYVAGPSVQQQVVEKLTGPGGATCQDQTSGTTTVQQLGVRRRRVLDLALDPGGNLGVGPFGGADPLRTACAGPSSADVLGSSSFATASVPVASLGARSLAVTFRGAGAFTGDAWGGARSGTVVVALALTRASGGSTRVPAGLPGPLP